MSADDPESVLAQMAYPGSFALIAFEVALGLEVTMRDTIMYLQGLFYSVKADTDFFFS